MTSLFRRRSTDVIEDSAAEPGESAVETVAEPLRRGYTPSKKERGLTTPKRPASQVRRPGVKPVPRSRKQMTPEERRELKEQRRQRRREVTEGMRRGDPRFLSARDRGPARALARDLVDARRTVGTWFFGGALIVLLGSSAAMPPNVRLVANVLWALLAAAVLVDSFLICRTLRRMLRERHPDAQERMGSLYLYAVMRAITFRKLRVPSPRLSHGESF